MKTFKYKTYLMCKDMFDCRNCSHYHRLKKPDLIYNTIHYFKKPGLHRSYNIVRLVDFKVCDVFDPVVYLNSLFGS